MALCEIGFFQDEIYEYMHLCLATGNMKRERLTMLNKRRSWSLHEIHLREMQLDRLDYLRYELQKKDDLL